VGVPAEFVTMVKDTVPPLVAMIEKNAPDNPDAAWNAILEVVEERAFGRRHGQVLEPGAAGNRAGMVTRQQAHAVPPVDAAGPRLRGSMHQEGERDSPSAS